MRIYYDENINHVVVDGEENSIIVLSENKFLETASFATTPTGLTVKNNLILGFYPENKIADALYLLRHLNLVTKNEHIQFCINYLENKKDGAIE